jgi:hypothetical protein
VHHVKELSIHSTAACWHKSLRNQGMEISNDMNSLFSGFEALQKERENVIKERIKSFNEQQKKASKMFQKSDKKK